MKRIVLFIASIFILITFSCDDYEPTQYELAYNFIIKDFKEKGTEDYYKKHIDPNQYGFFVYDTIYKFLPTGDNFLSKDGVKIKSELIIEDDKIGRQSALTNLAERTKKDIWRPFNANEEIQRVESFKGPTFMMVFSNIKNDSLRVDVFNTFHLNYCGSAHKYLFVFNKGKIESHFTWTAHKECF